MRDLRDPQKLGERLIALRVGLLSSTPVRLSELYDAATDLLGAVPAYSSVHQDGPLQKYGRPDQVQPRFQRIQVV